MRNSEFVKDGSWTLAGRHVRLKEEAVFRPKFSDVYKINPDAALSPESLSPTQLESLLSCPFQWYHKYYLNLKPSEAARSDTTKTRQGNLAHKMVEELVGTAAASEEDVQVRFPRLFDEYCEQLIPEYAEPDYKLEKDAYRKKLLSSLLALWKLMADRVLKPNASEYKFEEKDFCGVPFS